MLEKTFYFFHMFFGAVYIAAGSIMVICGIYFLLAPPYFKTASNIWTGLITVGVGILTIILTNHCPMTWTKSQIIFYSSIAVLVANVVNLALMELGEWLFFMSDKEKDMYNYDPEMKATGINAHYSTSITTALAIIAAFIHCQLAFWQSHLLRKEEIDQDDVSDSSEKSEEDECQIPQVKKKEETVCTTTTPLPHYSHSWVFDSDLGANSENESLRLKYPSDTLDPICEIYGETQNYHPAPLIKGSKSIWDRASTMFLFQAPAWSKRLKTNVAQWHNQVLDKVNGPFVQVNEFSGHYGVGDRHINHMKTFSRTPSPAEASHSSSSTSIAPIYECLERLTQPTLYKSRLTTFKNLKDVPGPQVPRSRVTSGDKEHYASLMVELENSFTHKKEPKKNLYGVPSSKNSTLHRESGCDESYMDMIDSRQRGSDAEFSKELEAALKLIQDLESPNTIDTPSETCNVVTEFCRSKRRKSQGEKNDSDSSKTSGSSSLDVHGKNHKTLPVESQSTSGYNSPSLDHSSRFTPIVGVSSTDVSVNQENDLSCVIRYLGDTAVISLFSSKQLPPSTSTEKVSVNNYSNEAEKENVEGTRTKSLVELTMKNLEKDERNAKAKIRRWRHFIERKRRPSLLPEVESAIIKSESLAFLSKSELKDRLNQTKNIHRQIEAKVHRQRSLRKADSFGSVEDLMDRHSASPFL